MDIPGASGAFDPASYEHAEQEAERLLEELKKEVKADIKDIGVLRKEMRITVPEKVIADHVEHNFSELMDDAMVPGFRKGRAPRQLIEKRYGADVRESLTTTIVGQAFFAATENNDIDFLGDPLFSIDIDGGTRLVDLNEALQHIKLPESGDLSYTCEIEVKPQFDLPQLEGIEVRAPEFEITDDMINERMLHRRKIRGRFELVSDGAAERDDQIVADMTLTVDGQEIKREENVTVGVRPTSVDGVALTKLDEVLTGAKPGDTRTAEGEIPDDYERSDVRGKTAKFEFRIHELKRLAPEPLDHFLEAWGFENEEEARSHFRDEMEAERESYMQRARRAQIEDYLLENTKLELPEAFSARQTERAVLRKVVDLQQRGLPMPDIEAHIDELRTSAREQVGRELKLEFIFNKVADELGVEVTDEEMNTEIAHIASQYGHRFDRIRDDLQKRGLLGQLVEQIRQSKCIDRLLADAKIVEAPADAETDNK